MTHYDDYPYPPPEQYTAEEAQQLHTNYAPRADTWEVFFPSEKEPSPKSALCIGCGIYEAIAVAAQAPDLLDVTAIDASAKVIEIAREKAGDLSNLKFVHADFMKPIPFYHDRGFDFIIASGVIHHVKDANGFVRRMRKLVAPSGCVSVMVYGDIERALIVPFCKVLETLGVARDASGIAFVTALLDQLDFNHPVKKFHRQWYHSDSQIVDMFLHPYFRQYAADDLIHLMGRHGFAHDGWFAEGLDYRRFNFGPYAKRFDALPMPARWRIGQILNCDDARLPALFRPIAK